MDDRVHRAGSLGWGEVGPLVGLPAVEAAQALADLTEISSQIEAAVLAADDGTVAGSTFADANAGERFAEAAAELLRSAAGPEREGAQELVQLQSVTPQGSVFVVRDGSHLIAAVTGRDPTVGLVFYDLKTCLRLIGSDAAEEKKPARKRAANKEAGGSS
jgi:predicted regulator of Ras-like GTPase activity (Roadblock/LC7/MglB family)